MPTVEFGRLWKNTWMRRWQCEVRISDTHSEVTLASPLPDGFGQRPIRTEQDERAWYAEIMLPGGSRRTWDDPLPLRAIKKRLVDFYAHDYGEIVAQLPYILIRSVAEAEQNERCSVCGKYRPCVEVLNERCGLPNAEALDTWTGYLCSECDDTAADYADDDEGATNADLVALMERFVELAAEQEEKMGWRITERVRRIVVRTAVKRRWPVEVRYLAPQDSMQVNVTMLALSRLVSLEDHYFHRLEDQKAWKRRFVRIVKHADKVMAREQGSQ